MIPDWALWGIGVLLLFILAHHMGILHDVFYFRMPRDPRYYPMPRLYRGKMFLKNPNGTSELDVHHFGPNRIRVRGENRDRVGFRLGETMHLEKASDCITPDKIFISHMDFDGNIHPNFFPNDIELNMVKNQQLRDQLDLKETAYEALLENLQVISADQKLADSIRIARDVNEAAAILALAQQKRVADSRVQPQNVVVKNE